MRFLLVSASTLLAIVPTADPSLKLIEEFDQTVQARLEQPLPDSLGMSRIMVRPSFGRHFRPMVSDARDWRPENDRERQVLARLEGDGLQVGLYLFGASILDTPAEKLQFRALKGPGAITKGTPRPNWYPGLKLEEAMSTDRLPDWQAIYPLARKAMASFADGGHGFETQLGAWKIVARPAIAGDGRCVACHNGQAETRNRFAAGDALGGVLYAYRVDPKAAATAAIRP